MRVCQLGSMESPWLLPKVHESIRMSSKYKVHAFRHLTCWIWTEIGKIRPKRVKSVWRVCESVWRSAWECVKVSQIGFTVPLHAFRHPVHWIWPKISQNRVKGENCEKSVWECVNVSPMNFPG